MSGLLHIVYDRVGRYMEEEHEINMLFRYPDCCELEGIDSEFGCRYSYIKHLGRFFKILYLSYVDIVLLAFNISEVSVNVIPIGIRFSLFLH